MMYRLVYALISTVVVAAATLAAPPAHAGEVDFDVRAGFYADDAEGPFVGAGLLTRLGSTDRWFFNPNVEFAFGDNVDVIAVNGDVHYDFRADSSLALWAGGGLAVVRVDPDFGRDADTDLGVNAFFGFGARRGDVRPYCQGKVVVADESELVVGVGLRF